MRKRARRDKNHTEIVEAFRKLGCTVIDLAPLGGGVPDILAGVRGENLLIEIKSASGKFTREQENFWRSWRGAKWVVRSIDDVAVVVKAFT